MNVALFGFMGVGKSVIGKLLSDRLGLRFVDLDEEIVKRTGKEITSIFKQNGEATFREMEKEVTKEIAVLDGMVIACGGGTVLDDGNLERLRRNSMMILLTAEPKTILERVHTEDEVRPLLMVEDQLERIQSLLSTRRPYYMRAADIIVDTSERTPEQVADEIMALLQAVHAR